MMRHTRKCIGFLVVAALFLVFTSPVMAQPKGGALMSQDVFTPIAKGYDFIREGKYDAAKFQFETAVHRDPNNSFAMNNLAVLQERAGHLNEAMALLQQATIHAAAYLDKVTQTCFAGGGCLAVKPVRAVGEKSSILPIVQENIKKLQAKMAAQKTPAPPGAPPPVLPVPPPTKAPPAK
jgi:tetratricopeptide (TPR) repeat protein